MSAVECTSPFHPWHFQLVVFDGENGMTKARTGIFSILLALFILNACDQSQDKAPIVEAGPAAVTLSGDAVMTAVVRSIRPEFSLPAIVEEVQSAKIRPQVTATIKTNHFTAGDIVTQGQLLVEMDDARLLAALESAEAGLQSAEASVTQTEANWARAEKLKPDGYISALAYDKAKAAVEVARSDVAQAKAALTTAKLRLDYTRIHAPFSGRISKPGHAVGDLVSAMAVEPLFELVQLDPIYVTANVELGVYNRFIMLRQRLEEEGQEVPELVVEVQLAGNFEYPHDGTFVAWDNTSSGSQGTIAGRTSFVNPDGMLLPGQNVVLHGEMVETIERIFVPQKAVLQDQQGHYVLTIGDDDLVQRKNLEVGIRDGADWAVKSGLSSGDKVIIEGAQRLAPGMKVVINNSL